MDQEGREGVKGRQMEETGSEGWKRRRVRRGGGRGSYREGELARDRKTGDRE